MSVYRRLATNSIQNQVKRGGVPTPLGQDCSIALKIQSCYQRTDLTNFVKYPPLSRS